ncbi:hypothetical protein ACHAPU_009129 [Fusarium lateritium]
MKAGAFQGKTILLEDTISEADNLTVDWKKKNKKKLYAGFPLDVSKIRALKGNLAPLEDARGRIDVTILDWKKKRKKERDLPSSSVSTQHKSHPQLHIRTPSATTIFSCSPACATGDPCGRLCRAYSPQSQKPPTQLAMH